MERKTLGVRIDATTWKYLEAEADRKGLTVSNLAREKLTLSVEFDAHINEFISDFINRHDISKIDFIECVIIDYMARYDAEVEVYGCTSLTPIPFFKTPEGELFHGDRQYEDLKSTYISFYSHQEKRRLLELEASGGDLSQRDRRFLIANKTGRAWFESSEYANQKSLLEKYVALGREARKMGLIPDDIDIPDLQVGKIYQRVVDGRLSAEDFIDELSNSYFHHYYHRDKTKDREDDNGKAD